MSTNGKINHKIHISYRVYYSLNPWHNEKNAFKVDKIYAKAKLIYNNKTIFNIYSHLYNIISISKNSQSNNPFVLLITTSFWLSVNADSSALLRFLCETSVGPFFMRLFTGSGLIWNVGVSSNCDLRFDRLLERAVGRGAPIADFGRSSESTFCTIFFLSNA